MTCKGAMLPWRLGEPQALERAALPPQMASRAIFQPNAVD